LDSQYSSGQLPPYSTRWSTTLESAKRVKEAMNTDEEYLEVCWHREGGE